MAREETTLVLGRGEVFFEPFLAGTRTGHGERYIGNTTAFQITHALERVDRWTSYGGKRIKLEPAVISEAHAVQFITDNISIDNVSMFYGQDGPEQRVLPAEFITESFSVWPGRSYQLGKSIHLIGVRNVDDVVVYHDGEPIVSMGNWDFESAPGRLNIDRNAADISDGMTITVEISIRLTKLESIEVKPADLFGALRFIAHNAVGPDKNYFFPMVRLSPRGQLDLKGDQWQQMPFEAESNNLSPSVKQLYIDEISSTGLSNNELAIIAEGLALNDFPYWENELYQQINYVMPTHNYLSP